MTYGILNFLVGKTAKSLHPITLLNPSETFIITECKISNDTLYIRGEDTCWFEQGMIRLCLD